ncbi:MoaD/ThiS family protein [uncultured Polaribacter sp.]|uniref:MoaD/ThiS family protein n=1 Tax=uncultured Polaribacter sp. TaxID=174711 RepID=UPI00261C74D4|nr:MoaD/ThiS family protein [uncultured Polaribacter sp.]
MKIKTLFFGITTDLVGETQQQIDVKENTSINDFKLILKSLHPQLENINSYAIAVNEDYAANDVVLKEFDVVAIIPPVSGG